MNQMQKIEKAKEEYFQEIYDDVGWAFSMAESLLEDQKIRVSFTELTEIAKLMLSQMNVYANAMTEDEEDGTN
jgi:mevalonate kinase